jgi:hypothetical protein
MTPGEQAALNAAIEKGDPDQMFLLLASYLERNQLTVSDEVLRLYLERGLFACLQDHVSHLKSLLL